MTRHCRLHIGGSFAVGPLRIGVSGLLWLFVLGMAIGSEAATYDVGPNQPYTAIGHVPWELLQAGDIVQIFWRSQPYKEKWVLCLRGTQQHPIIIRGVLGPHGERPVIDGANATTRAQLSFWAGARGVIVVGGANVPADKTPAWITIENLEVIRAHPNYQFTDDRGVVRAYSDAASSIYVEKGDHITIKNTVMRDSANGFFVASSDALASSNILVVGNYLYSNGISGSIYQHNSYTAARGIVFHGNRFGPMRSGANGNGLKDRSSGLVVRYNWIEGGNRQLDLVDAEDSVLIRQATAYHTTYVYGNVLIEPAGAGNQQIVHYGGDHPGMEADFRKGTLYFYNNTVVSTRTDRTTLFRLSTNDETADARNNIFYATGAGSSVSLLDDTGRLVWRHNWLKPGFVQSFGASRGSIDTDGSTVVGSSPGFANETSRDYHLLPGSACRDAGAALHAGVLPRYDVVAQYVKHQSTRSRSRIGTIDIGAYEYDSAHGALSTPSTPQIVE
jgi:hypothetical protein